MDPDVTLQRSRQLTAAIRDELAANRVGHLVASYDRDSDELLVYFNEEDAERPGVSCPVVKNLWTRLDRETGRPLGFQFDHFLSVAAMKRPSFMDFMDIAELRGISIGEFAHIRRQAAKDRPRETISEALGEVPLLIPA